MRKILAVIIVTGYLHRTNSFLTPSATKRETVVRRFPLSASPNTVDTGHHDIHPAKVAGHPSETVSERDQMIPLESTIRKVTMMAYIASMCVALPMVLLPVWLCNKSQLIDKRTGEQWALDVGQFCARWLLYIMPFVNMKVHSDAVDESNPPEPSIWVCNHTSMLDTFIFLASDLQLRGSNKRPIKAIYWKGLEKNPVTNVMFKLCGFIPIQMEANGAGIPNEYDKRSFITLIRNTKKAFAEGFDILVLPEGQLNPRPESGLMEVFPGAHKLSLMSKRPIRMVAMHGLHNFWHADESIGMRVTGKDVNVRAYSRGRIFESGDEFVETFRTVVGHFGTHGVDLSEKDLEKWLDGTAWQEKVEMEDISRKARHASGENVEQAILSTLERERPYILETSTAHEGFTSRTPVGVHMCNPPLIMHELVPTSSGTDFAKLSPKSTVIEETPKNVPQATELSSLDDIEQAIRSVLERERHTTMTELEDENLFSGESEERGIPVGVHTCRPPLTKHSLIP